MKPVKPLPKYRKRKKTSDTFQESAAQLTEKRHDPIDQLPVTASPSENRNLLIGGSVAAILVIGVLIWSFSGSEGDKPISNANSIADGSSQQTGASDAVANLTGSEIMADAPPLAIAPFNATQAKAHQAAWGETSWHTGRNDQQYRQKAPPHPTG